MSIFSRLRLISRQIVPRLHSSARTMSTEIHNTNKACCSIPPVQSDYEPKGVYKSVGDFKKVYVSGPEGTDSAIVCIFDIFGYYPQTQQGADILASTLKTTVYMPDYFEDSAPYPLSKFPPSTPEEQKEFQAFFGGAANPPQHVAKSLAFGKVLKSVNNYKNLGLYGFCWGGKIAILSGSTDDTPYNAVSIVHPAMLSPPDVEKIAVPLAVYISKDEPIKEYNEIVDILSKKPFADKNDHKNYDNQIHGFAAARGDLKDPENLKQYEDVYGRLANFFKGAF
ncbi:dienelactone hydrolase [Cylindrobasidium torrendii FP15055 ss-10]|uniref:Dienelactone hydrolase n=1 Tax=Cylindrobasidium torrendii FP15055 ss-10 TaxID=1314674 RepID=A0A0D7BA65_9AGAR|nr:dienelactone hydrolase [Cylindrobasidium torrendii FP15055 ss-10]